MSYPTIDHRGPEFAALGFKVLADVKKIFKTTKPVIIYSGIGHGRVGGSAGQYLERWRPCADL